MYTPVRTFRRVFGLFKLSGLILQFLVDVVVVVWEWIRSVIANLYWLLPLAFLFFGGSIWFNFSKEITQDVEYIWRCEISPWYPDFFRPFFCALTKWWKNVCWWNVVGQTQRLLSGKLVWDIYMNCENGFRIWNMITNVFDSVVYLVSTYLKWFFVGNPIDNLFPIYPWLESLSVLTFDLQLMITCACQDLRILIEWFSRILRSNNLLCGVAQILNSLLNVLQTIVQFTLDIIELFFAMIITHPGDIEYLIDNLTGEVPGFQLPTMVTTTERITVATYYLGQFLNDALQITVCTGKSEIEAQGDITVVEQFYESCMLDTNNTRVDLFCFLGPLVGIFFRGENAAFNLVLNVPRILSEFVTLPAGPRFLTDDWVVNQVYDTARYPPAKYDFCSSENEPILLEGSNVSAIVPPQPIMYGDYTNASDVPCDDYRVRRFVIPCANCSEVMEYDLVGCLCKTSRDLDNLIVDLVDFKIFDGLLCCGVGGVIRVITAIVKFAQGLLSHIIVVDRFPRFITDQNNYDAVIDEIVGPYYEIGGLLGCARRILVGFDPRLECLATVIVNLIKPVVEAFRIGMIAVVRALNDLFGTGCLGFFDVVCTSQSSCFDLEARVFQYLRRPRFNYVFATETFQFPVPNYNNTYVEIDPSYNKAWIECFCELTSFQFLNQFADDPIENLPDFCCGLEYAFRAIVEIVKFLVEFLFSSFETLGRIFDPGRPLKLTVLGYLSCQSISNCAPIGQILSDILDFLKCPCVFVQAIDDGINMSRQDIPCICQFITAVANVIYYIISIISLSAQVVAQLAYCVVSDPVFPGPFCEGVLERRVKSVFGYIDLLYEALCDVVGTIGCVLGLLFRFDCVGSRYFSPPDYDACELGSSLGVCSAGDRLTRFFKDVCALILAIPKFITDTLESFALLAFQIVWNGFLGMADLVYDFLIALGGPLFGIAGTNPTTGVIQSLGLVLNCFIGPPTDECINETTPALGGENASGHCIGDIFVVLGNAIRDIYEAFVNIISSFVGIIEALLAGNGELLQTRIIDFITGFFDLVVILLGNLGLLVEVIVNVISGIVSYIFGEGVGAIVNFFLTIATTPAQILLIFFRDNSNKRFVETFYDIDSIFEGATFDEAKFKSFLNSEVLGKQNLFSSFVFEEDSKFLWTFYQNHFKALVLEYVERNTNDNTTTQKRYYGHFDINTFEETMSKKRQSVNPDDYSLSQLDFISKTQFMQEHMDQGSFCQRLMESLSSRSSLEEMSKADEFLWNYCYIAYIVPLGMNRFYDECLEVGCSDLGIRVPENVFYDPTSFLHTFKDILDTGKALLHWNSQSGLLSSGSTQDIVVIKEMPKWFWEYEKQVYELNAKKRGIHEASYSFHANSSEDGRYVHEPNEIWERVSEDMIFINLPGESISVPVINGKYPTYLTNVTFLEYLAASGLRSETIRSLSISMDVNKKSKEENTLMAMYTSFTQMVKNQNFSDPVHDSNQTKEEIFQTKGPSIFGGSTIWKYFFHMNEKEKSRTSHQSQRRKSRSELSEEKKRESLKRSFKNIGEFAKGEIYGDKKFVLGFNWKKYFSETLPNTITSIYERLTGKVNIDDIMFSHYVSKVHNLDVKDLSKMTFIDERSKRNFHDWTIDHDTLGSKPLWAKNLGAIKRDYLGKYGENKVIDDDGNVVEQHWRESDTKTNNHIRRKHGHVLQNKSLVSHRVELLKKAGENVTRTIAKKLSHDVLLNKIKKKYLEPYLKIISDTIRVKKTLPTFHGLYALANKLKEKTIISHLLPSVFETDSFLHRFITQGHSRFDDENYYVDNPHLIPKDETIEHIINRTNARKRAYTLSPPVIPLCLPGNEELVCDNCDACEIEECNDCQLCRNCTEFLDGTVECERCAVCVIGGPDCRSTCGKCENCRRESTCLNCRIIEILIASVVDFVEFCIALTGGDESVIKVPPPGVTLIKIWYNNDTIPPELGLNSTELYLDPVSHFLFVTILPEITDVNIPATIVYFIKNANQNPFKDSVGLIFFARRWIHAPFIRQCNRDIDLQCTFGVGLEEGIKRALIVCLVLGVVAWFIFPPVAGIITGVIVSAGWVLFFFTLVFSFSWFLNPYCLVSPTSIIYSAVNFLFFGAPILPLLPRCAADQILALLDKYVKACYDFPYSLTADGNVCPTCLKAPGISNKLNVTICQNFGFTNQFTQLGFLLQRYALPVNDYLNATCLVKGGCLFGLSGEIGPIYPFFEVKFNITYDQVVENGTTLLIPTNYTDTLDSCFWFQLPGVLTLLIFIAALFFFWLLVAPILPLFLRLLRDIFSSYPFNSMVPYPFNSLLYPTGEEDPPPNKRSSSASGSKDANQRKKKKEDKKSQGGRKGDKKKGKKGKKEKKLKVNETIYTSDLVNSASDLSPVEENHHRMENEKVSTFKRKKIYVSSEEKYAGFMGRLKYIWDFFAVLFKPCCSKSNKKYENRSYEYKRK